MDIYTLEDLGEWEERIFPKVIEFGLDCFEQEFEICDHNQMIGAMAYSGAPSHYPHWSFGKAFAKIKTLYEYGVSGLPYEMVINSDPSIAYLMKDNSLLLQILTMAHVYGHTDFFKNNVTFNSTNPKFTLLMFKSHADRIRYYIESVGDEKVELFLDAAHSLSLQCRRNLLIKKQTRQEQIEDVRKSFEPPSDSFSNIHKQESVDETKLLSALQKNPLKPDPDILLFIRDNNRFLENWQKDILTIVHEEAEYFIPQIETKIMNEGWASFWHKRIVESLGLPQGMMLEFMVRHSQVIAKNPHSINPYYLGLMIWEDICHRYDEAFCGEICEEHQEEYLRRGYDLQKLPFGLGSKSGMQKVFEVRAVDRDSSFIRNYLGENLMREMNLISYERHSDKDMVTSVSDDSGWKQIKNLLIQMVGMGATPVINVEDDNYNNNRILFLKHEHDGVRDLQLDWTQNTMKHIRYLWQESVALETIINGRRTLIALGKEDNDVRVKPLY